MRLVKILDSIREKLEEKNLVKVKISDIRFKRFFGYRLVDRGSIKWDEEQLNLKDKIKGEGFDQEKYGYIIINHKNLCLNGHHRIVILKELYGEDHQVTVSRVRIGWYKLVFFAIVSKIFGQ
jgi:hypothetical protein